MAFKRRAMPCGACVLLLLAAQPLAAEITPTDLQVAGRALGFMTKPLSGDVNVGLIYAPDSRLSVQEAQSLQSRMSNALKIGNSVLKPLLVPMNEVSRVNVGLFFLTPGTGTEADTLARIARAKHIPCITTDVAQVTAGRCAVGIRSQPRIEIIVNRVAAAATGVSFPTVFRMMITEI
jgi:hypothetical protein